MPVRPSNWIEVLGERGTAFKQFRIVFLFSLRADIYNQICRDLITNVPLFNGCSETFLRHLCMVMVPNSFMPGDYICMQVRQVVFVFTTVKLVLVLLCWYSGTS